MGATAPDVAFVAIMVVAAFAPSVAYAAWVRNHERAHREPWSRLARAFVWGAVGGVVLGLLVSRFLAAVLERAGDGGVVPRPDEAPGIGNPSVLVAVVLVAPLAEEFAKALGLLGIRDDHLEPEDGMVYGAAAGFGFAATENLLYGFYALATGGLVGWGLTALLRSFTSSLLHGAASAVVGFALWRVRLRRAGVAQLAAFYLVAVALHGAYNLAASAGDVVGTPVASLLGLAVTVVIGVGVFRWMRGRVRKLDRALARE